MLGVAAGLAPSPGKRPRARAARHRQRQPRQRPRRSRRRRTPPIVIRNGTDRVDWLAAPAPAGARVARSERQVRAAGLDRRTHPRRRLRGVPPRARIGRHDGAQRGRVRLCRRRLPRAGEGRRAAGPDVVTAGYHVRPRIAEEAFLSDPSLRRPDVRRDDDRADAACGADEPVARRRLDQDPGDRARRNRRHRPAQAGLHRRGDPRDRPGGGDEERAGPGARARRRRRDGGGQGRRAQHRARHLSVGCDAAADEGARHVSRSHLHDRDRRDGAGRRLRRPGAADSRRSTCCRACATSSSARTSSA